MNEKTRRNTAVWTKGLINGFKFWVMHFDEGSMFGIDCGRISKLEIRRQDTGERVVYYDRFWDMEPEPDSEEEAVYLELLARFN